MKKYVRILALVLALVMTLPLLAACGNKKPAVTTAPNAGTTAPSTTGPKDPVVGPETPEDPAITAKKQAIAAVLNALTANGGSADSQITAQLKADIVAKLWGETAELPLDTTLGTLTGAFGNTQLSLDLYNTLLAELAKIGALNDNDITIKDGDATYTVPAEQLEAILGWWASEENVAGFLQSILSKAQNDPTYVISDKSIVAFVLFATLTMGATSDGQALPGHVEIPQEMLDAVLVYLDGDDFSVKARPCTEAEDGAVIAEYLSKKAEFDAFLATVTPLSNPDETIAKIVEYADYILALEARGYYTEFHINVEIETAPPTGDKPDAPGYGSYKAVVYATNAIPTHTQETLNVLRDYNNDKDMGAMIDAFLYMAIEELFYTATPEFDNYEDYLAYIAAHKDCTKEVADAVYAFVDVIRNGADYDALLAACDEILALRPDCSVYLAGMHLSGVQNALVLFKQLLVTLNPAEDASIEDIGIHQTLAMTICSYLQFEVEDENGEPTEAYVEFAALLYDLLRAVVYGEEFDLPTHADALLTLFAVPLTYEELTTKSFAWIVAKLNDSYDFESLLLNPDLIPSAEDEEFIGMVAILDEKLLSFLTLDDNGEIDESVFNKEFWENFALALYDYAVETQGMFPDEMLADVRILIEALFDGETDAFATLADALVGYIPLSKPEEALKEGVIGEEYGVLEYRIRIAVHVSGTTVIDFANNRYLSRDKEPDSFDAIDEFLEKYNYQYENVLKDADSAIVTDVIELMYAIEALSEESMSRLEAFGDLTQANEFRLEYLIEERESGYYEVWGEVPTTIYVPVADADLTAEEQALITAFRTELADLVAAYEAMFYATEETAEAVSLAYVQAYVDLLVALADISAADYGVGAMGGIPAEMLQMMIVIYSYPLAETPTEGNYAILEGLTGMSSEEIAQMMAGVLFGLFTDTEALTEETFNASIELCEKLLACFLDTESEDDPIVVLADLIALVGENYNGVNAEAWAEMFGSEAPADEEVKTVMTVVMMGLLAMTDSVEDYNAYFDNLPLPSIVETIDFNLFYEKLKSEATYESLLDVVDINVVQNFEGDAVVGATIELSLSTDFDILLASLKGGITLTFDIVY